MDRVKRGTRLSPDAGVRVDLSFLVDEGTITEVTPDILDKVEMVGRRTLHRMHLAGVWRVQGNVIWLDAELSQTVPQDMYDIYWMLKNPQMTLRTLLFVE